jgi:hypothetical protein
MKNNLEEGNIGEVYSGIGANGVLQDALHKADNKQKPEAEPSNLANEWVDIKLVENEIVPNFNSKTTYGQLFKDAKTDENFPREINDVIKFKKWYSARMKKAA